MRLLLIGSTDLTRSLGELLITEGMKPVGCCSIPQTFPISYSPTDVHNIRDAGMPEWSKARGIPQHTFENNKGLQSFAHDQKADAALVAGWYHMVPKWLRDSFPKGCLGLHASLLPDLRGGAPLNWAILSGRKQTGMSLFSLGDGVDEGPLYGQKVIPINERECIGSLVAKSEEAAQALLRECLPKIVSGELQPYEQTGVSSYCQQRRPEDGCIDWTCSAEEIDRLVRAVSHPYPGAYSILNGKKVLIWKAKPYQGTQVLGMPGQIARVEENNLPLVCTGQGLLQIDCAGDEEGEDVLSLLKKSNHQRFHS